MDNVVDRYPGMREPKVRDIHRITSRNLFIAAYRGGGEWIGIREKFDSHFLFTEDATVRTVGVYLDTVPEDIRLTELVGEAYCELCGTAALYTVVTERPRSGTWSCTGGCARPMPTRIPNRPLFRWLQDVTESAGESAGEA